MNAIKLPRVSVIVPCFNSGEFLQEAIDSVKAYGGNESYEIIVVDDGSTDERTLVVLDNLRASGCNVIRQENKGPAAARNTAIRSGGGQYLLFLDSDNRVRPEYIDRGVAIMDKDPSIDVVYGNPHFFGEIQGPAFRTRPFDLRAMFLGNYIDMCSVVRKSLWSNIGGLDESPVLIGHEDWEFWIRAYLSGAGFYYVNETLFDYRRRHDSVVRSTAQPEKKDAMRRYVYSKHLDGLLDCYRRMWRQCRRHNYDIEHPLRAFLKYSYYKFFSRRPEF